jgi:hypothetical protein
VRTLERARTAERVPPYRTATQARGQERIRIDRALVGIDVFAIVVLGAGLIAAFLGR